MKICWENIMSFMVTWTTLTNSFELLVYNECPLIKRCGCTEDSKIEGGIVISCKNITTNDLQKLPLENMTRITIIDSTFQDPADIGILRKSTLNTMKNITVFATEISHFSWEYMPDNIMKITLGKTKTKNIFSSKELKPDGTFIYECGMQHIKNITALYLLRQEEMRTIPPCLPPTLARLSFKSADLSSLGEDRDDDGRTTIIWPESLKILQFSDNNITTLADRVFANSPQSLTRIIFRNQPIMNGAFLLKLPASTLLNLRLQSAPIASIFGRHFEKFRKENILQHLAITYCNLVAIPMGIPTSVSSLHLEDNKIKVIDPMAVKDLTNLKYIGLKRNLLKFISVGLPKSLEDIQLPHNQILSCHTEAFIELKNLTTLNLSNNRLMNIPTGISHGILHFDVQGNQISEIGPHSNYEFCANCKVFNIFDNPWACNSNMIKFLVWISKPNISKTISSDINKYVECETGMPGLNDMILEKIMSTLIIFQKLGCFYNVAVLNCTSSKMETIPRIENNLKKAIIVNNALPMNGTDYVFYGQKSLTRVQLENIGLFWIPRGLPESILYLSLANNKISSLSEKDGEALKNLTNVREINLKNNKLFTMPMNHILSLSYLEMVDLFGNPLICNCELWPFIVWLYEKEHQERLENNGEINQHGTCHAPMDKIGTDITFLKNYFWYEKPCIQHTCEWDRKYPDLDCSYGKAMEISKNYTDIMGQLPAIARSGYWKKIKLSGLGLQNTKIRLNHLYGLININLSNNSLNSFPLVGLPGTVQNLTLKNNNISSLPSIEGIKRHLPDLKYLDLQKNKLTSLNEHDVQLFPLLTKFLLHQNPLVCDCKLRPFVAWIAANHDNPSVMRSHELERLTCYAPWNLAGDLIMNLTEAKYCPDVNVGVISGGLVAGVLFLIVLAIACNIYMHRKCKIREKEAILQGFRELLQQEAGFDDTDPETGVNMIEPTRFKYDAFVSYAPHEEDTEFAMWLLDELEIEQNYKLCVHERDFVPGTGIADNIVECIGASKRIILILSNHFVTSPWCQYEVQIALTELHQKRKSKLLVPILLEELDGKVEGSVKTFLSLIKGIRIPHNQSHSQWTVFWNEIKEAMPEEPIQDSIV